MRLDTPLHFDYDRVPRKYWAAATPDAELILYKGAVRGQHRRGFRSLTLHERVVEPVHDVKGAVESGDEKAVQTIVDRHTNYYPPVALLSATFNPQQAQVYAPTRSLCITKKTIYQLRIRADRCILDADNIGCTGLSRELLVLGVILPSEITAVKKLNTDEHSELLYRDTHGFAMIARFPDRVSTNTAVRDPLNWRLVH